MLLVVSTALLNQRSRVITPSVDVVSTDVVVHTCHRYPVFRSVLLDGEIRVIDDFAFTCHCFFM